MPPRRVTEEEWESVAVPACDRVFRDLDAFCEPFRPEIRRRALLFPMRYELEPPQLDSLRQAAAAVGETTAYLEYIEYAEDDPRWWEISLADEKPYGTLGFWGEVALFSPGGLWGLITSHEDHAVIGGSDEFMRVIERTFPPTEAPWNHLWAPATLPEMLSSDSGEEWASKLVEASTPIEVRAGEPFGEPQAIAFLELMLELQPNREIIGWLPPLFEHIYGAERAAGLLRGRWGS